MSLATLFKNLISFAFITTVINGTSAAASQTLTHANAAELCWNSGALPKEAQRTIIVVSFSVNSKGRPRSDTIKIESALPSREAGYIVLPSARRAIIRCGVLMEKIKTSSRDFLLAFSYLDGVFPVKSRNILNELK